MSGFAYDGPWTNVSARITLECVVLSADRTHWIMSTPYETYSAKMGLLSADDEKGERLYYCLAREGSWRVVAVEWTSDEVPGGPEDYAFVFGYEVLGEVVLGIADYFEIPVQTIKMDMS